MNRRHLLKAAATGATFTVAGCLHDDGEPENGDGDDDGNDGEGGDAEDVGRTDEGEERQFTWTFEVTRLEAGDDVDEADVEFDRDANEVVVRGTTWGSDLCKTAELDSASILTDVGEEGLRQLHVGVATRDVEYAGDLCAEAIREIDYEATFSFDDEDSYPDSVRIRHDGREVAGAAWDGDTVELDDE